MTLPDPLIRLLRKPLVPAWTLLAVGVVLLTLGALINRPSPQRPGDALVIAGVLFVGIWVGRRAR